MAINNRGYYARLTKNIQLPFAPFKGLRLIDECDIKIVTVNYSVSKEKFFCSGQTTTFYSYKGLDKCIDAAVKEGWNISEDTRVLRPK
jgi:hypothetical protein